jgi:hypothetical protein
MPLIGSAGAASARGFGFGGGASFPNFSLSQALTNPSGVNGTWFGWDMSSDESASKLLISAVNETGANPTGAVYYYTRSGNTFSNGGRVIGYSPHNYQFGRGVGLSKDGNYYGVSSGGNRQYLYSWPNAEAARTTATGPYEEATYTFTGSASPPGIVYTQNKNTAAQLNFLSSNGSVSSLTLNSVGYVNKNIKSWSSSRIALKGNTLPQNCNIYTIASQTGQLSFLAQITSGSANTFGDGASAISGDGKYLFIAWTALGVGYLQVLTWNGSSSYTYSNQIAVSGRSRFGISVVTNYNGDVVAVGDDASATRAAFIFQNSSGTLSLKQTINDPNASAQRFSYTMCMNQNLGATTNYLVIGDAFTTNSGVANSGTVYIYTGT